MDAAQTSAYAKRHSRWMRPTGGSIQITERDLDYLELLFEIGPLRANFLHALVSPSVTQAVTSRRLNKLFCAPHALVDRPRQQRESYSANYSFLIYELTAKGEQLLADRGRISNGECRWRAALNRGRHVSFWHEVLLGEVLASLQLAVRNRPSLRFISWREVLQKAPASTRESITPLAIPSTAGGKLVPDSIFGLEYLTDGRTSYRFFALEADRATEPVRRSGLHGSSYSRKVERYRELVAHNGYRHFGIPNLLVLTVTTNGTRKESLITSIAQVCGASNLFLFKHLTPNSASSTSYTEALLGSPWQRAGYGEFDISKP